jgi:hypothetical protein
MAQIEMVRQYRKKETGKLVFVYKVLGKANELDAYREQAGDYLVEDDNGVPLFFSTRLVGAKCALITTQDGRMVPDTSEMDMQVALIEQYGGAVGNALAEKLANKLTTTLSRTSAAGKPVEKKSLGDLG